MSSRMRPVRGQRDRAVERRHKSGSPIGATVASPSSAPRRITTIRPRIAAIRGSREFRQVRPGGEGGAAEQGARADDVRKRSVAFTAIHRHLLWNSGDIEKDRHRLLAQFRALDGAPGLFRSSVRRGELEQIAPIEAVEASRAPMLAPRCRGAASCLRARPMQRWCPEIRSVPTGDHKGWPSRIETAEIAAGIIGHAREEMRPVATRYS